ncbi:MAG: hypothetical protein AAGJ97_13950 [Planctomycetota bacterium]
MPIISARLAVAAACLLTAVGCVGGPCGQTSFFGPSPCANGACGVNGGGFGAAPGFGAPVIPQGAALPNGLPQAAAVPTYTQSATAPPVVGYPRTASLPIQNVPTY